MRIVSIISLTLLISIPSLASTDFKILEINNSPLSTLGESIAIQTQSWLIDSSPFRQSRVSTIQEDGFARKFPRAYGRNGCGGREDDIQRFGLLNVEQRSFGICTAFLIAPDLLVTAGHCVLPEGTVYRPGMKLDTQQCGKSSWLFGITSENASNVDTYLNSIHLPANNIYNCKYVIGSYEKAGGKSDWAIIKLNKKVKDRRPLVMAKNYELSLHESLSSIGSPRGMPLKYFNGYHTLDLEDGEKFKFSHTAVAGQSGSPLFNGNLEIVGIISESNADYTNTLPPRRESVACSEYPQYQIASMNEVENLIKQFPMNKIFLNVQRMDEFRFESYQELIDLIKDEKFLYVSISLPRKRLNNHDSVLRLAYLPTSANQISMHDLNIRRISGNNNRPISFYTQPKYSRGNRIDPVLKALGSN